MRKNLEFNWTAYSISDPHVLEHLEKLCHKFSWCYRCFVLLGRTQAEQQRLIKRGWAKHHFTDSKDFFPRGKFYPHKTIIQTFQGSHKRKRHATLGQFAQSCVRLHGQLSLRRLYFCTTPVPFYPFCTLRAEGSMTQVKQFRNKATWLLIRWLWYEEKE